MTKLHEACQTRNKKINKIESLKSLKSPRSVIEQLDDICQAGYDKLKDEDSKFFLKCFGLFDKNDGTFMIRLRIPGGQLESDQAYVVGNIAKEYGKDYIDITTRQQIELRYIPFEALASVIAKLDEIGITTYQTGIDNFRNIVTSPLDGLTEDHLVECMPLIDELQSIFLKRDEWIGVLPRKFNAAILGTTTNDCNIFGHDCCFVPAQKEGINGFNLYLGGKVGVQAIDSGLFIKPESVKTAFESVIQLFKEFGFKDNRNKNRLHYLIESVGMEEFSQAIQKQCSLPLQSSGVLMLHHEQKIDKDGTIGLANGNKALLFSIPSGIFSGSDLMEAAVLTRECDAKIRLSVEQSFYIVCNSDYIELLKMSLLYQKYRDFNNTYFTHQIACAGNETCSFGVIPNKRDAIEMAHFLNKEVIIHDGKIRMHWSACPKGCGIHGIADIGFEGCKAKDVQGNSCYGVHIFVGGKASFKAQEARMLYKNVPLIDAKYIVKKIVQLYKEEKLPEESFESYDSRVLADLSIEEIKIRIEAMR